MSNNNVTVKNILNGETIVNFIQISTVDNNEHQDNIKTVHSISNKLLINYGENYSQFRTLNTNQNLTLNSKTIQPLHFVINKLAQIGASGMEGVDNFSELSPVYTINSDTFIKL